MEIKTILTLKKKENSYKKTLKFSLYQIDNKNTISECLFKYSRFYKHWLSIKYG